MGYASRPVARTVSWILGPTALLVIGVNVPDYLITRDRLRHGYTPEQAERKYQKDMNDPLGRIFSFIGKPGRELAYRAYEKNRNDLEHCRGVVL